VTLIALIQTATADPGTLSFLQRLWVYLTLGATGIVMEEVTPLVGGVAAQSRHVSVVAVGLWIAAGTWVATLGLYYLGRWRGRWVRLRWPKLRRVMLVAFKIVRRHPWRSALAVRWAYGLRITLPIACGGARMPVGIYMIATAISSLTWSFTFTLVGWIFGQAAMSALGHLRRYEHYIFAGIVVVVAAAFFVMRKRHVEDDVVEVLAKGDPGPVPRISEEVHTEQERQEAT
jgi:membrane protein DedA with SNARE-associated domain